jgi:glycerophosphoryl diester phosphodiesterase
MAIKRGFIGVGILGLVAVIIVLLPGYQPVQHSFFANVTAGHSEVLAHGGGQGVAPTNTLLALQTAAQDRADILEVDVQLTKDNVLVVHHDDTLDRTTDLTGPVAALTWAQIKARDTGGVAVIEGRSFSGDDTKVAKLDDVLAALPGQRWNIEIKNDSQIAAQQLCHSIQSANIAKAVLVASFHDKAMATFRAACPQVATSMAPGEIRTFIIAAHMRVTRFVKTPAVAVQVPVTASGFDLTHPRFVAALKARNIKLHYWTINDPDQMRDLLGAGADGLLTDFVTRGQKEVARAKQRGLPAPALSRP